MGARRATRRQLDEWIHEAERLAARVDVAALVSVVSRWLLRADEAID